MHFGFFQWVAMGSCMPRGNKLVRLKKMVQRVSCKDKFLPVSFYDFFGREAGPVWFSWVLHASPQSPKGPSRCFQGRPRFEGRWHL